MGDMLYMTPGASHLFRVHGAFVSDDEIENVKTNLSKRGKQFSVPLKTKMTK
jgi:S-DNA-T family DNA segregation ATPase FtsK/SpoIIIE